MFAALGKIFRFIIIGSCSVALILQFINTALPSLSCNFVYKSSEENEETGKANTIDFGLYHMGINSECLEGKMDDLYEYDNLLDTARGCNITSMIAGAIGMLLVLVECWKCKIPCGGLVEGIAFFIAWTNGLSVFMVFGMEGCGNYFHTETLQGQLDNMTSVAELIDSMDANPKTEFTMNSQLKEKINNLEHNPMNITELVPSFVEIIPFGTKCEWGQGATFNLIAALLYLGCGILLCVTPRPVHGNNDDNDNSSTHLSQNENEDLRLATTTDNAKIV